MGSRYCLRILFALFPAYVTCLGSYEEQIGTLNDPVYSFLHLPHRQGTHGSYNYHNGRLVAGSNIKSDPKACQTPAKSDDQENMINFRPSASHLKVPQPHPLKPSRGEFYTKTFGSSSIFVVKPPIEFIHQHHSSKGSQSNNKVQIAGSSYGPLLKGTPVHSSTNPNGGFEYMEGKSSVVSSGPLFVVQGGKGTQGHGDYSDHPDYVKPLPSYVDSYQASQLSRDIRLTASSQGKSLNQPHDSISGTQCSPSPELRKPSKNDCRDNVDESLIAGSGEIPLNAPGGAQNMLPRYEVTHPKFQQTYNDHGQINQPFEVTKNSINVRPDTSTYASSSRTGFQTSTVKGTSNKPNSRPSKPSNEINTVRVRLNKPLTRSFGNFQNQWAPGGINIGAFQSSLPPNYLGQRSSQNPQMPVGSSGPQYSSSKGVQSQFTISQGNEDYNRHFPAIPSGFGQGAIRRLIPTLSSNYRQANQPQVNRMDSSAPKFEGTQNSPAGPGQQGLVQFQEVNLSV